MFATTEKQQVIVSLDGKNPQFNEFLQSLQDKNYLNELTRILWNVAEDFYSQLQKDCDFTAYSNKKLQDLLKAPDFYQQFERIIQSSKKYFQYSDFLDWLRTCLRDIEYFDYCINGKLTSEQFNVASVEYKEYQRRAIRFSQTLHLQSIDEINLAIPLFSEAVMIPLAQSPEHIPVGDIVDPDGPTYEMRYRTWRERISNYVIHNPKKLIFGAVVGIAAVGVAAVFFAPAIAAVITVGITIAFTIEAAVLCSMVSTILTGVLHLAFSKEARSNYLHTHKPVPKVVKTNKHQTGDPAVNTSPEQQLNNEDVATKNALLAFFCFLQIDKQVPRALLAKQNINQLVDLLIFNLDTIKVQVNIPELFKTYIASSDRIVDIERVAAACLQHPKHYDVKKALNSALLDKHLQQARRARLENILNSIGVRSTHAIDVIRAYFKLMKRGKSHQAESLIDLYGILYPENKAQISSTLKIVITQCGTIASQKVHAMSDRELYDHFVAVIANKSDRQLAVLCKSMHELMPANLFNVEFIMAALQGEQYGHFNGTTFHDLMMLYSQQAQPAENAPLFKAVVTFLKLAVPHFHYDDRLDWTKLKELLYGAVTNIGQEKVITLLAQMDLASGLSFDLVGLKEMLGQFYQSQNKISADWHKVYDANFSKQLASSLLNSLTDLLKKYGCSKSSAITIDDFYDLLNRLDVRQLQNLYGELHLQYRDSTNKEVLSVIMIAYLEEKQPPAVKIILNALPHGAKGSPLHEGNAAIGSGSQIRSPQSSSSGRDSDRDLDSHKVIISY